MFKIFGGDECFQQWSQNYKLIMSKLPVGADVHFYNDPGEDDPLTTEVYETRDENGNIIKVCNVPNILVTTTSKIKVCVDPKVRGVYGDVYSVIGIREKFFDVTPASKPDNYVYEETPTEGGAIISDAQIKDAVNEYFENNSSGGSITDDEIMDLI